MTKSIFGGDNIPWPWSNSKIVMKGGDGRPWPWARRGDDDPIPWTVKFDGGHVGSWTKGVGEYGAAQNGPIVEIVATGFVPNINTVAKLIVSPIAVFPPEFALMFYTPGIALPATMPFTVTASFYSAEPVNSVSIWDANGKHVVPIAGVLSEIA